MSKKVKKILIVQLSILEVILFGLLFDNERTSCAVVTEKDNLLVYNYSANNLLEPKIIKEEVELDIEEVDEDVEEEINSSTETLEEEKVVSNVVEESIYEVPPVIINDVNYSVAQSLIEYAKGFVGYPYVYGGNSLTNGTDCSGFTKLIYAQYGVNLPRVAYDQSFVGVEVPIEQIQIGDLVLSGYGGQTHHVAIYIGNNQIVHALNPDAGIVITGLYNMPITHVRRVL